MWKWVKAEKSIHLFRIQKDSLKGLYVSEKGSDAWGAPGKMTGSIRGERKMGPLGRVTT
jgi:hypothetical protein